MKIWSERAHALGCSVFAGLMVGLGWLYGRQTSAVTRARLTAARAKVRALEAEIEQIGPTQAISSSAEMAAAEQRKIVRAETLSSKLRVVRAQEAELHNTTAA